MLSPRLGRWGSLMLNRRDPPTGRSGDLAGLESKTTRLILGGVGEEDDPDWERLLLAAEAAGL